MKSLNKMVRLADKCLEGQMPGSGVCPAWTNASKDKCLEGDKCLDGQIPRRTNAWTLLQAFGVYFCPDKCQEDKCLESIFVGQMPRGQMPEVKFWSDKCQEDKCQKSIFGRTNARRKNAWSQFLVGKC